MRISVLQERLAEALKITNKIVDKTNYKVAGKVKLETRDARLFVTVTDLETTISQWLGAKIDVDGVALLPAKTLIDAVCSMSPERLDMELDTRAMSMRLHCGNTLTNIKGFLEEYPDVVIAGEPALLLDGKYLYQAIQQTAFAVTKDADRPLLTGVNFEVGETDIGITALDGFRVSNTTIGATNFLHVEENFTVPSTTIGIVNSILGKDPNVEVLVGRAGNHVIFNIGGQAAVSGVLLEGAYPNWRNLIPTEIVTTARVHGEELELACNRVRVMTFGENRGVTGRINKGALTLYAQNMELGDALDTINAEVTGEEREFVISLPYLADPKISGPVDLSYAGERQPIMMTVENWVYLVMPMSG